jgi:hypothetical protein
MRLFFFSGFALMALSGLLIYFSIYFWAYLLFFVGLFNLFMNVKKAFLNDPVLIVDKLGITDNMNFPTLGLIEWDLIKEVTKEKVFGFDTILVYLHDPEAHIKKQNFLKRKIMRSNIENIGTSIMFRCNVFPEQADKVIELMNRLAKGNEE